MKNLDGDIKDVCVNQEMMVIIGLVTLNHHLKKKGSLM